LRSYKNQILHSALVTMVSSFADFTRVAGSASSSRNGLAPAELVLLYIWQQCELEDYPSTKKLSVELGDLLLLAWCMQPSEFL
jgi:hypothetical protein